MDAEGRTKAPPMPTTVEEIAKDYVSCGSYMRRKDASNEKPSPILEAKDVLRIALFQMGVVKDVLHAVVQTAKE